MSKLHIAYVDDEPAALRNFRYTVESWGGEAQIHLFSEPEGFLLHVKNNPTDMAFLDIDLPGTTGFVVAEKLKTTRPDLPIAFVTGNIQYMYEDKRVVEAPYMFKPYGKEELFALLDAVEGDPS